MESEKYYTEQAERFLKLMFMPKIRPVNKKTVDMLRGEKAVMLYLYDHDEGVTAGQLSTALEIGSGGIANLLNALERKGLIKRTISSKDRRKIIVTLDPKGREEITAQRHEVLDITQEMLTKLGAQDTSDLIRILTKLKTIGEEIRREREETIGC